MADRSRVPRYQRTAEVYQKQLGAQPPVVGGTPPTNHRQPPVATVPGPAPIGAYVPPAVQPAVNRAPGPAPAPSRTGPPLPSGAKRPDPRNLPNPTKTPILYNKVIFNVATKDPNIPPPPAHSKYIVNDRSSCSPRFMRSTLNQIPTNKDIFNITHLPFAVAIQPLADVGFDEYDVPVVDLSPNGPLRCRRCAAYINPYSKFIENGRAYVCALCGASNEVPNEYFAPLEPNGQRRDLAERHELWRGSVDFLAPPELSTKPASPPTFLFVIDVSSIALQAGILKAFTNSIRQILDQSFAEDERTMVGFITVDRSVHFWKLAPKLQMIVLPDVANVFEPMPHSAYLANYASNYDRIDTWLKSVPQLFTKNDSNDSALGAAVHAASLSLGHSGGRIIAFQASLPNMGPGALKTRDEPSAYNSDREKALLTPQTKYFSDVGAECAKRAVVVDLFLCPSAYIDVVSLGQLAKATGGQVYYFPQFNIAAHEEKFFFDLRRNLTRKQGSDAILRLRCSEGLTIESYNGHFVTGATGQDVELAGIDADKTLVANLAYDDKIPEKQDAVVQAAMLYTNPSTGQRMIRVHTLALRATSSIVNVFKAADVDAVMSTLARRAIVQLPNLRVNEIRTKLTELCIDMLASYRKNCAKSSSEGQLILPESLKLMPIYLDGLIKTVLLNNLPTPTQEGLPSNADGRAYLSLMFSTISLEALAPCLYPRMYHLNMLADSKEEDEESDESDSDSSDDEDKKRKALTGEADHYGSYWLPPLTRLSSLELLPQGIYLLDDAQSLYLAIHSPPNPQLMTRLFDNRGALIYNPEDDFNRRVHNVIMAIRHRRPYYQSLLIFDTQQNSSIKRQFFSRLMEDGNDDYTNKDQIAILVRLSYAGYLCHVHRSIQDKLYRIENITTVVHW